MIIIDRRLNGRHKNIGNKKRFIDRHKKVIKEQIDNMVAKKALTDATKDREIKIPADSIEEPSFSFDYRTGDYNRVLPGNKRLRKGDRIPKPGGGRPSGAGKGGGGKDDFTFTLTMQEFLDLYFDGMELPNFVKNSLFRAIKYVNTRAGYTRFGIPSRLSLKKTFEKALGRRIATRSQIANEITECEKIENRTSDEETYLLYLKNEKKPRYLDDFDLRYNHFTKIPKPIKHAVMFCVMDVSGSLGEREKKICKKFFLLLYLFLHKTYKTVEVVFIVHTDTAYEVVEEEFFECTLSGGTAISPALELVNTIITERYDLSNTNLYIAQSSDGDNWPNDNAEAVSQLEKLFAMVQYYAYLEVATGDLRHSFSNTVKPLESLHRNFRSCRVEEIEEVYPALRKLFTVEK